MITMEPAATPSSNKPSGSMRNSWGACTASLAALNTEVAVAVIVVVILLFTPARAVIVSVGVTATLEPEAFVAVVIVVVVTVASCKGVATCARRIAEGVLVVGVAGVRSTMTSGVKMAASAVG